MQDIISTVLDIEHEAQDIIKKARSQAEEIKAHTTVETEKMRLDYETRMNERIAKMDSKQKSYCAAKLEELEKHCGSAEKALDEKYKKNRDAWVDMLFAEVFGDEN